MNNSPLILQKNDALRSSVFESGSDNTPEASRRKPNSNAHLTAPAGSTPEMKRIDRAEAVRLAMLRTG